MKVEYQRWDSETEQWVDFSEFVKFNQPTWVVSPEKFDAWIIKLTPKGERLSSELMKVKQAEKSKG